MKDVDQRTQVVIESQIADALESAINEAVTEPFIVQAVVASILVVICVFLLRYFLTRYIKSKAEILDKNSRRWLNRVNNASVFATIFSLIFIWGPEIQNIALSLTAVAVAVVLITKELLMCLTGGFLYATTKPFDVGDWITIDNTTGEVTKITPLVSVIEEVDSLNKTYQYTGKTIQIPNSRFLSIVVENGNFLKDYIYCDVPITIQYADLDPGVLMGELKSIAERYYAPFHEESEKFIKKVERKTALNFSDPEPQYFLRTTDVGHNIFTARLLIPTKKAVQISSDITKDFLKTAYDLKMSIVL
ncbi:mechanosensitive ion channel [Rickettsiales bacterium]|nr:mechanosensitive ion channel [Rickettsiales bacterium]